MPPIETFGRFQKAVLWRLAGNNNYGVPVVFDPVEIQVRWEDVYREATDPQGNVVTQTAEVVTKEQITIGSIMWKGALEDLPSPPTDLRQVIGYSETPDLKNRNKRRTLSLMRFGDELPASAAGTGTM